MSKIIYFDMDGTIANFYAVENWLERLRTEDATVYSDAAPLYNEELIHACAELLNQGWEFGVITWGSMTATPEFDIETERIKRAWVERYLPFIHEFHYQHYGTPKQQAIGKRRKTMILIDDNIEICREWNTRGGMRKAINVNAEFTVIDALTQIIEEE